MRSNGVNITRDARFFEVLGCLPSWEVSLPKPSAYPTRFQRLSPGRDLFPMGEKAFWDSLSIVSVR